MGWETIGHLEFRASADALAFRWARRHARRKRAEAASAFPIFAAMAAACGAFASYQMGRDAPSTPLFHLLDRHAIGIAAAALAALAAFLGLACLGAIVDPDLGGWADHVLDRRLGRYRLGTRAVCRLDEILRIEPGGPGVHDHQSVAFGMAERSVFPVPLMGLTPAAATAAARLVADFLGVPVVEAKRKPAGILDDPLLD